MPTLDPNRELDEFIVRSNSSHERYIRVFDALVDSTDASNLRKGLAVDAAFRLGSEWELFQHRWHVACIARDGSRLIAEQESKVADAISKLPTATREVLGVTAGHLSLSRLTGSQIERLVHPLDRNVVFPDVAAWSRVAKRYLAPPYVGRVQRIQSSIESSSLLDLLKALRNAIAHGSRDSKGRLNRLASARVAGGTEGLAGNRNAPLVRAKYGIADIGTYLHTWTGLPGYRTFAEGNRMTLIHDRTQDIAKALRV
ncbi:MAG: hypothetical protein ABIQ01_03490 [Pseudolysinimonas sp.]